MLGQIYWKQYKCSVKSNIIQPQEVKHWNNAFGKHQYIGALFMDLSKALDCLSHGLTKAKLHGHLQQFHHD